MTNQYFGCAPVQYGLRRLRNAGAPWLILLAQAACGSGDGASGPAGVGSDAAVEAPPPETPGAKTPQLPGAGSPETPNVGEVVTAASGPVAERPYRFLAPLELDPAKPLPLLIMLHAFGVDSAIEEGLYLHFSARIDSRNFLYAFPDGTVSQGGDPEAEGSLFWNATGFGPVFSSSPPNDVAYINAIIDDVASKYNVDPRRIFVFGHSNGGSMAHQIGCELSSRVAAIASMAGATWNDPSFCNPTDPISVLEIHGDADTTCRYEGGTLLDRPDLPAYPGARTTAATWADLNGCTGDLVDTKKPLNLNLTVFGRETLVESYAGCRPGGTTELWTMRDTEHIPLITPAFADIVLDFLLAHPKP